MAVLLRWCQFDDLNHNILNHAILPLVCYSRMMNKKKTPPIPNILFAFHYINVLKFKSQRLLLHMDFKLAQTRVVFTFFCSYTVQQGYQTQMLEGPSPTHVIVSFAYTVSILLKDGIHCLKVLNLLPSLLIFNKGSSISGGSIVQNVENQGYTCSP